VASLKERYGNIFLSLYLSTVPDATPDVLGSWVFYIQQKETYEATTRRNFPKMLPVA
jgi:hypothetical protein